MCYEHRRGKSLILSPHAASEKVRKSGREEQSTFLPRSSFQLLSDWNHSFLQPVYNLLSPHVMTRLSWNSASEGTRVESVFSPWRQSENFYAVLRSKIALLKMEERRGSQEAEEHLRGERAESLRLREEWRWRAG